MMPTDTSQICRFNGHLQTLLPVSYTHLDVYKRQSSNFTVSLAAQYWRREDFGTVFAAVNPIANLICAFGPMLIAILMISRGYQMIFKTVATMGVICIILMLLFSAKHVKEKDDKYRAAAGKELDDALVGRKLSLIHISPIRLTIC